MIGAEQLAATGNRLVEVLRGLGEVAQAAQIPPDGPDRRPRLPALFPQYITAPPQRIEVKFIGVPVTAVQPKIDGQVVSGPEGTFLVLAEDHLVLTEQGLVERERIGVGAAHPEVTG